MNCFPCLITIWSLPDHFNSLLPYHQKQIYSSLFAASWQTIATFGQDHKYLGAKAGMIAILHTWGQQLWLHPHIHCIVPAGGITKADKWKMAIYKEKYLFPKRAMSLVFRARFIDELRKKMAIPQPIAKKAFEKKWVVYAKRPFASPKTVVEYLGRYTHKIAISNHRLVEVNNQTVCFTYKDYRHGGIRKQSTLSGTEFLRRFSIHILPYGFVRIRHYGFLASGNKPTELNIAKRCLKQPVWEKLTYSWVQIAKEKLDLNVNQCPDCNQATLAIIKVMDPRGPPTLSTP